MTLTPLDELRLDPGAGRLRCATCDRDQPPATGELRPHPVVERLAATLNNANNAEQGELW